MAKTVCVDFNGVLDNYDGWHGDPYSSSMAQGADLFLKRLNDLGYEVVILTSADTGIVTEWLEEWGLSKYVKTVTNHKIPAFAYVDDRAINHNGDFLKTLKEIETFEAHWEKDLYRLG